MSQGNEERTVLRDFSLPVRLTLAAFLISVGCGYLAAMVQLKVQLAGPGRFPPSSEDVIAAYAGKTELSQLQRLLIANDSQPFNGQGSMRAAFTKKRSNGWPKAVKIKAEELKLNHKNPADEKPLNAAVAKDRDGERRSLLAWLNAGHEQKDYDDDKFFLEGDLAALTITSAFVGEEGGKRYVKIQSIITTRCVRCHSAGPGGGAAQFPLETWEDLSLYLEKEKATGMSLAKLAQTSHVHLLGFSMLWGLTGLIFAMTSYPGVLRAFVAPAVVVAQLVDISCWWLARLDAPYGPIFAQTITITGGLVGAGLFVQIVGSLFNMFGTTGRIVLVVVALGVGAALGFMFLNVVQPALQLQ